MEDAKQAEGQGTGGGGGGPGVTPGGFRLHRRPALAPSGQEAPRWGPLWHWVWPVSRRHRGWRLHYRLTTERPRGPARSGAEEALPCGLSRAGLRPVPHPRDVPRSPPPLTLTALAAEAFWWPKPGLHVRLTPSHPSLGQGRGAGAISPHPQTRSVLFLSWPDPGGLRGTGHLPRWTFRQFCAGACGTVSGSCPKGRAARVQGAAD